MAKEFGIPVQFQRYWLWAKRQNHTYRPNRPLTTQEDAQCVSSSVKDVCIYKAVVWNNSIKKLYSIILGFSFPYLRHSIADFKVDSIQIWCYCLPWQDKAFLLCLHSVLIFLNFNFLNFLSLECLLSSILLLSCQGYFLVFIVTHAPFLISIDPLQVRQLREVSNKANNAELKLLLEVELGVVIYLFFGRLSGWLLHATTCAAFLTHSCFGAWKSLWNFYVIVQDLRPLLPPEKTKDDILIFFKLYDPSKEELR